MSSFALLECTGCRARKHTGESLVIWRGDWECGHCHKNNFKSNIWCHFCLKQKYKRGPGLGGDADGPAVKRARGTEEATTSDDIIRVYGSAARHHRCRLR